MNNNNNNKKSVAKTSAAPGAAVKSTPPATDKAASGNSQTSSSASTKAATASTTAFVRLVIVALLVALAAVLYNRVVQPASSSSSSSSAAVDAPAPAASTINKKAANVEPHTTVVDGVVVQSVTINETVNGDYEVVGAKGIRDVDADKLAAYMAQVEKSMTTFRDERAAVPLAALSNDAATARLERLALFLEDQWSIAEFMMYPFAPHSLLRSPTLLAESPQERKKDYDVLCARVRSELGNYYAYQVNERKKLFFVYICTVFKIYVCI